MILIPNNKFFLHFLTIFIFSVIFTTISFCQALKTKDGFIIGDRNEFITLCSKSANSKLINIKGLEVETSKYCSCISDNLIPNIYSGEILKAIDDNKVSEFLINDKNIEILIKCLEGIYYIDEQYKYNQSDNPELQRKIGIKTCIYDLLNDNEIKLLLTKELIEKFCTCAYEKMIGSDYTYKDLILIEDENSLSFNEIALPCISEVLESNKDFKSSNDYDVSDIIGGSSSTLVPLIDFFGKGFKIKINIGDVSKYYIFDTGATDLTIDKQTEQELLNKGVLKKENYLNKAYYSLANNQIVVGQMAKVNNIMIGEYIVNNVVITILEDSSLLCGKSFLDKFKSWKFDKQNKVLIIYK